MKCSKCGAESSLGARFCEVCGNALGDPAPAAGAQPVARKKGRGCLGWGCLVTSATLVVLLVLVGVGAALLYRVPQRLGIVKSPAERLLLPVPDRLAAQALKEELAKSGVNTQGMDIYVFPMKDREGSIAYAVLDSTQGFRFSIARGKDPIIDYMSKLATSKTATDYKIQRVAIDYRGPTGEPLVVLTADTKSISGFAQGSVSRDQFMKALEGQANWPAFFGEVLQ